METIFWVASVLVQHTLLFLYIGLLDTEKIEEKKEERKKLIIFIFVIMLKAHKRGFSNSGGTWYYKLGFKTYVHHGPLAQ